MKSPHLRPAGTQIHPTRRLHRHRRSRAGSALVTLAAVALAILFAGDVLAAGLMRPADGRSPALDLRDQQVTVMIEDGYAITTIEQVFTNPNATDLEAIYAFPVPEKAAVAEFTYWIGGTPVTAEVLPKVEARAIYEDQKAQGNEAGLAEQDSHKTFDISVWPVRAGGDVRIRLSYIQPARIDTGVGRYVYPLAEGNVDAEKLSFWTATETVSGRFSFDLQLRAAYPVEALRLPSHPAAVVGRTPEGYWTVHLDNGIAAAPTTVAPDDGASAAEIEQPAPVATNETGTSTAFTLDQDIVVYWRHANGLPGSVDLVAHKAPGADRGTFMMVLTPGDDLAPITRGRDWTFVLDKSGSMAGGKFTTLSEGVARALRSLPAADRFRLIAFDTGTHALSNGFQPATEGAIAAALNSLNAVQPDNGTNLYAGLNAGMDSLTADRTSAVVLITDGVANVGVTARKDFLDMVRKADVRLYTAIIGNSANTPLLEGIAKASGGFALTISTNDDIIGAVLSMTSKATHEALHGVTLSIDGVRTTDIAPRDLASLYRGQQLIVFGHYFGDGPATVTLRGKISGQPKSYTTSFAFPARDTRNPKIERLWAYAAIEDMLAEIAEFGDDADLKDAITATAVAHGLVTPYTSMLVVREDVFQALNIDRTNARRLETEAAAQAARSVAPVQNRQADSAQPMFAAPRATHSGGNGSGAIDPLAGLLVIGVGILLARSARRGL